jgi:class 3 adenylate cyclase
MRLTLPLLLVLTLGAVIAVLLWRRRARMDTQSRCGQCGYVVTGLPSFTCPECGSDLRVVGFDRGKPSFRLDRRATIQMFGLVVMWTLIYTAAAIFLGARSYPENPWDSMTFRYGLVDAYVWPYEGKSTHAVTLTARSEAYQRVTITEERHARFRGWRRAPVVHWTGDTPPQGLDRFNITLQIDTNDNKSGLLHVDTKTLNWRYVDPEDNTKTLTGGPIDADQLWSWMMHHGVNIPSPLIKEEADTLANLVTRSVQSGTIGGPSWAVGRLERIAASQRDSMPDGLRNYPFTTTRGSAQDKYGPAWSIYWLSIPFGLGVFTYGTNWILNRHRKKTAPAASLIDSSRFAHRSRTLTVLFTDVKDFTARVAGISREQMLALLGIHRRIVEEALEDRGGMMVKAIGDAFLATFESATNAVLAAMQIQRATTEHNATAVEAERLDLRIALCTGEVTLADGDVFGTPVNIASRLQALAEIGEVYFTESTWHAMNTPEIPHQEVGMRELKGIGAPVKVYRTKHALSR